MKREAKNESVTGGFTPVGKEREKKERKERKAKAQDEADEEEEVPLLSWRHREVTEPDEPTPVITRAPVPAFV